MSVNPQPYVGGKTFKHTKKIQKYKKLHTNFMLRFVIDDRTVAMLSLLLASAADPA